MTQKANKNSPLRSVKSSIPTEVNKSGLSVSSAVAKTPIMASAKNSILATTYVVPKRFPCRSRHNHNSNVATIFVDRRPGHLGHAVKPDRAARMHPSEYQEERANLARARLSDIVRNRLSGDFEFVIDSRRHIRLTRDSDTHGTVATCGHKVDSHAHLGGNEAVLSAGGMRFNNGHLYEIDTETGQYQTPGLDVGRRGVEVFAQTIIALGSENIDVRRASYSYTDDGGHDVSISVMEQLGRMGCVRQRGHDNVIDLQRLQSLISDSNYYV